MRLKKLAGSISMFLIAALVLIINSATSTVAEGLFKITAFSISNKAAGVDGTAELNSEGNVENSVVFYNVGDYVEYQISLQNTSSDSLIINDITIDDTAYFTYLLSNNHAGETIAPSEDIAFSLKVTYENENNTNDRHLGVSSININYSTVAGNTGSEEIPYENGDNNEDPTTPATGTTDNTGTADNTGNADNATTGSDTTEDVTSNTGSNNTTETTGNADASNDTDEEELVVPNTNSNNTTTGTINISDDLIAPNTGDSTNKHSTDVSFNIALAIAGSAAIITIAYAIKHHKKLATALSITILAFTFVSVTRAEEISADIEIPIAGMINLKDKIAVTFHTEGMEDTFIFRQLGETLDRNRMYSDSEMPARGGYYLNDPDYLSPDEEATERFGYDTELTDSIILYPHWHAKFANFQRGYINYRWSGPFQFHDAVTPTIANRIKTATGLTVKADDTHPVKIASEFKRSTIAPTEEEIERSANISDSGNSQEPIYAWYDEEDDTIYWWTIAPRVYIEHGEGVFASLPAYKIDLTGITTNDVNTFEFMFADSAITEFVFPEDWDTSKSYSFQGTFRNATFESIDLSMFSDDHTSVYNGMFSGAKNLKDVNLSSFTAKGGSDFEGMFADCKALEVLDLSSFKLGSEEEEEYNWHEWNEFIFDNMFANDNNLTTIYVSDDFLPEGYSPYFDEMDMESNSYLYDIRVFDGANKLVGGNGTTYQSIRPGSGYTVEQCEDMGDYVSCWGEPYYVPSCEYPLMWIDGKDGRAGLLTRKETE